MLNQFKKPSLLAIFLIWSSFFPINVFCSLNEMKKANLDTGLAGYWPMDEDFAITKKITDFSGKENHGTASVNLYFIKEGISGGAAYFDGQSYIDCGNAKSLDITNAITLAAWVKPLDLPADIKDQRSIINKYFSRYCLRQDYLGRLNLFYYDIDKKKSIVLLPLIFLKKQASGIILQE